MLPPVHVAAELHVPPLAVTVRPPRAPVVSRMMPFADPLPFDVMLRKVRPLAPIVVLLTLSAVAVVVARVLAVLVDVTVPPPEALKALPVLVLRVSRPVKLT